MSWVPWSSSETAMLASSARNASPGAGAEVAPPHPRPHRGRPARLEVVDDPHHQPHERDQHRQVEQQEGHRAGRRVREVRERLDGRRRVLAAGHGHRDERQHDRHLRHQERDHQGRQPDQRPPPAAAPAEQRLVELQGLGGRVVRRRRGGVRRRRAVGRLVAGAVRRGVRRRRDRWVGGRWRGLGRIRRRCSRGVAGRRGQRHRGAVGRRAGGRPGIGSGSPRLRLAALLRPRVLEARPLAARPLRA